MADSQCCMRYLLFLGVYLPVLYPKNHPQFH